MRKTYVHFLVIGLLGFSCEYTTLPLPVNCEKEGVVIDDISVEDSECGSQNGQISVTASGGTGIYRYKLNDGPFQAEAVFGNLDAGSYFLTVEDEKSCQASMGLLIKNKDGVNIEASLTAVSGCGAENGSITIMAVGGEPPYSYKISGGAFQDNNVFTGLSRDSYTVTVKDGLDCQAHQTVQVTSGISFSASIEPIISNNCAINDCHNGNQVPDFRQFSNVRQNAAKIKELTGDRTMPKEGSLTQEQIDLIGCWVDDGAMQN